MDTNNVNDQPSNQWDAKAPFWDNLHGDTGNTFHKTVVSPPVERLLALRPGERVLDIACGNGTLARRLTDMGGIVTATDFSPALIERAKARGQVSGEPIDYRIVDATDENALKALGTFDAITCTMALMDIADIAPLFRAVRVMLNKGGRFVFATAHPAFNSSNPVFFAEYGDDNGTLYGVTGVKISAYMDIPPTQAVGAKGEPIPHTYYHRTLTDLLNAAFSARLVLDGIEEAAYPIRADNAPPTSGVSWDAVPQIPPVLVGRLR